MILSEDMGTNERNHIHEQTSQNSEDRIYNQKTEGLHV